VGWTEITSYLAQGSAPPPGAQLPFDVLLLCATEYQPASSHYPGVTVLHVPLNDDGSPPTQDEIELAKNAAMRVSDFARRGKRVLVTCRMGRNRSGLVSGLALVEVGHGSLAAIRLVQSARTNALCGGSAAHFREVIHSHARLRRRDSTASLT
jgi:protein-tyrosine phosphatase